MCRKWWQGKFIEKYNCGSIWFYPIEFGLFMFEPTISDVNFYAHTIELLKIKIDQKYKN